MQNDDTPAKAWLRALQRTSSIANRPARIFPIVIEELADTFTDNSALISDRDSLTFTTLSARANQYARWALGQGLRKGDVVCLGMRNCAEYLAIWTGITSIGGVAALLNTIAGTLHQ